MYPRYDVHYPLWSRKKMIKNTWNIYSSTHDSNNVKYIKAWERLSKDTKFHTSCILHSHKHSSFKFVYELKIIFLTNLVSCWMVPYTICYVFSPILYEKYNYVYIVPRNNLTCVMLEYVLLCFPHLRKEYSILISMQYCSELSSLALLVQYSPIVTKQAQMFFYTMAKVAGY